MNRRAASPAGFRCSARRGGRSSAGPGAADERRVVFATKRPLSPRQQETVAVRLAEDLGDVAISVQPDQAALAIRARPRVRLPTPRFSARPRVRSRSSRSPRATARGPTKVRQTSAHDHSSVTASFRAPRPRGPRSGNRPHSVARRSGFRRSSRAKVRSLQARRVTYNDAIAAFRRGPSR